MDPARVADTLVNYAMGRPLDPQLHYLKVSAGELNFGFFAMAIATWIASFDLANRDSRLSPPPRAEWWKVAREKILPNEIFSFLEASSDAICFSQSIDTAKIEDICSAAKARFKPWKYAGPSLVAKPDEKA